MAKFKNDIYLMLISKILVRISVANKLFLKATNWQLRGHAKSVLLPEKKLLLYQPVLIS